MEYDSSPRSTSTSSTVPSQRSKNIPKKRPSLFSGLLGAKEPSAQAFADYQKTLLKQRHGRTGTAGLPGVSSAKLPPTVPKVNSKWDGVPAALKAKDKNKEDARKSIDGRTGSRSSSTTGRSHSRSTSTAVSQRRLSRGTLGGVSTHSNASSTNRLADLYGWETNSNTISSNSSVVLDFATEHRPMTARVQTSHSAPAPLGPALPLDRTLPFPADISPSHQTSPSIHSSKLSPSITDELNPPSLYNSPAVTPSEPLPPTPDASPRVEVVCAEDETTTDQLNDMKTTVLEAPASVDEVIIRSAGLNILGPPAPARRKGKASQCQPGNDRYKETGSNMPLRSILKKDCRSEPDSYFTNLQSVSPATSIQNEQNLSDKAGLCVSSKDQAIIAPWPSPSINAGMTGPERIGTPTPEGGHSLRKKGRMSIFKK
ncbi:hypothetical protein ACLMJK_002715 [Lecanora helva]